MGVVVVDLAGSSRGTDADPGAFGGEALAGREVEAPAVEGADELVALDLAEHRQVGLPVGAGALTDVLAETDLLVSDPAAVGVERAQRLGLGTSHPLA